MSIIVADYWRTQESAAFLVVAFKLLKKRLQTYNAERGRQYSVKENSKRSLRAAL